MNKGKRGLDKANLGFHIPYLDIIIFSKAMPGDMTVNVAKGIVINSSRRAVPAKTQVRILLRLMSLHCKRTACKSNNKR